MAKATKIRDRELDQVKGGAMSCINAPNTDTCEYATYDTLSESHPVTAEPIGFDGTLTKI